MMPYPPKYEITPDSTIPTETHGTVGYVGWLHVAFDCGNVTAEAAAATKERVTRFLEAAPDVYAALKSARAFVKAELDVRVDSHTLGGDLATLDETDDGICAEAMRMLEQIDAALAKAEGRT